MNIHLDDYATILYFNHIEIISMYGNSLPIFAKRFRDETVNKSYRHKFMYYPISDTFYSHFCQEEIKLELLFG